MKKIPAILLLQLVLERLQKSRKVKKDSFSKINLLIRNNYIGIYTVCLPLEYLKGKNFSFKRKNLTSTKFPRYVFLSSFFFWGVKNFISRIKFSKITNLSSITIFIFNSIKKCSHITNS